jgi:hypothetical protein
MEQIFAEWGRGGKLNQGFGVADELRCCAVVVQEDLPSITRAEFTAFAEQRGYNKSTAGRCWAFVREGN